MKTIMRFIKDGCRKQSGKCSN